MFTAVGIVVTIAAVLALVIGLSGRSTSNSGPPPSAAKEEQSGGQQLTTTTDTVAPQTSLLTTTTPPSTTSPPERPPSVDESGNQIVDGWFIIISSARKGTIEASSLPAVAASNDGHVIDTDSYQTGFATDGRSGSLNEQAAIAPNFWPGSDAIAAVVGPFQDRFSAEEACRRRGAPLGSCVRQLRPLNAVP